jgi:hypothetical protein
MGWVRFFILIYEYYDFIFRYEYGLGDDFFLRWLYTPRVDGLPRVLSVQIPSNEDNDAILLLIGRIKKV